MASNFLERNFSKIENDIEDRFEIESDRDAKTEVIDAEAIAEIYELLNNAKFGKVDKVLKVLDEKPHYLNHIPKDRAWGVLHQAAYSSRKSFVLKVLSYPQCDPFIKTNQDRDNKFGPGRTADELATKKEIKDIILEAQARYKSVQTRTSRHLKENSNYQTKDENECKALGEFIELGDWENVVNTLTNNRHLINVICPKLGLSALHKMAIANNLNIVTQLLSFPASNPTIETVEHSSHKYGTGQIPEQLTKCQKVLDVILEKKEKLNQFYLTIPIYVLQLKADGILVNFFLNVLQDYNNILCPSDLASDLTQNFPSLLYKVYKHIDTGTNWKLARQEVAFQIRNFDVEFAKLLAGENKTRFFASLVHIYTGEEKKSLYSKLNEMFQELIASHQEGASVEPNLVLGTYALILNSLLMYWQELESYKGVTYRVVNLGPEVKDDLVENFEFTSLNFLSSSGTEELQKNFKDNCNCMLVIDNSTECPWSPKLISKYASKHEEGEYLYPCGARFRVVKSAVNYVDLKLISPQ